MNNNLKDAIKSITQAKHNLTKSKFTSNKISKWWDNGAPYKYLAKSDTKVVFRNDIEDIYGD